MTGADVKRRREAIRLAPDDLAEALGEHLDQLTAWEGIEGTIPRTLARRLDWCLALAEREAAVKAAGVPECSVVATLTAARPAKPTPESLQALNRQLETHAASCSVCQRRQAVWDAQPPLPPVPLPIWVTALGRVATAVERLPPYLRPAVWGALGFGAMTFVRSVFLLAAAPAARAAQAAIAVCLATAMGGYGGAIGGIAHHFARQWSTDWGRRGDFFTGVAVTLALALGVGIPLAIFGKDPMFRSGFWWGLLAVAAVLTGLVLGLRTFRSPGPSNGG